jgi:hypothetical protein
LAFSRVSWAVVSQTLRICIDAVTAVDLIHIYPASFSKFLLPELLTTPKKGLAEYRFRLMTLVL